MDIIDKTKKNINMKIKSKCEMLNNFRSPSKTNTSKPKVI